MLACVPIAIRNLVPVKEIARAPQLPERLGWRDNFNCRSLSASRGMWVSEETFVPSAGRYASLQCELVSGSAIGGKIHKYPSRCTGLLVPPDLCVMEAKMRVQDQSLDSPVSSALWMILSTI